MLPIHINKLILLNFLATVILNSELLKLFCYLLLISCSTIMLTMFKHDARLEAKHTETPNMASGPAAGDAENGQCKNLCYAYCVPSNLVFCFE